MIWVSTLGGIDKFNPQKPKYRHIFSLENHSVSGVAGSISTIFEDDGGALWLGTSTGRIMYFDPRKNTLTDYTPERPHTLPPLQRVVRAIIKDRYGKIWVARDAIFVIDPKTGHYRTYRPGPPGSGKLLGERVLCIIEDRRGTIWAGTPAALNRFDRKSDTFKTYLLNPDATLSYSTNSVTSIAEDSSGFLWLGTVYAGISRFDPVSETFTDFKNNPEEPHIPTAPYRSLAISRSNDVWLGTEYGLYRFNPDTRGFTPLRDREGMPLNYVHRIVEDGQKQLWLISDNGLVRYNLSTNKARTFDKSHGIPTKNVVMWSDYYNALILNTGKNLYAIHPDSLQYDDYVPPVYITRLERYSTDNTEGMPVVEKGIMTKDHIEITNKDNILVIEFAGLSYRNPANNQYAYKLEGFTDNWIQLGTQRRVTFTNLDPGKYTFRVKGSNADGVWNETGTSLSIVIHPPWWRTRWAYSLYVLAIWLTLAGIRRYEMNRQQLKHNLELEYVQREKEQLESEKLKDVDRLKSRFFANISHEFRTPLTLILGPLEQLITRSKNSERPTLQRIQRNARRLQILINQLLDLSKLESGKMTLHAEPADIIQLTKFVTMAFESLAGWRKIELDLDLPDKDKYEKILANLLSNALKFTPEGGKVQVKIAHHPSRSPVATANTNGIMIPVSDTGSGIPPDQLPHIFDRFYQPDSSHTRAHEGTGIGLALTKELVELHGGNITVESVVGKGTTFSIWLPLGKTHLQPEQIAREVSPTPTGLPSVKVIETDEPNSPPMPEAPEKRAAQTAQPNYQILIVEDNPEMRHYMRENLDKIYRVMEAENGKLGLKAALRLSPDLIISDVMMPEMDGFEMCAKLKTDARTSHIPVILLTARASSESKIEGLETGADDYLTKPFNARELEVRVKNLIEQRRRLQERFQRELLVEPSEVTVTSMDEQFLQKVMAIVEAHMDDAGLDTNKLAHGAGVSRRHLNRKLRALTGQSVREFIRSLRMKRAAQLLQQQFGSVTEIAYEVGFQSIAHFAKVFRKQFGVSPSEFANQNMNRQS